MMVNSISGLQGLREDKGLSSKELARQVGVATSAIWGFESGAKKMSEQHAERLAQFFDVPMETLLHD
ncbi:helix-turn-helix domain-containing protein [Metaplanococcus flavidus]|uniref:Helix-turn-helix domain-containing protein n=1 Tax=Metaplanococcus flavidus TaxID=569883 RepID=A0ABW3LDW4_9BACL